MLDMEDLSVLEPTLALLHHLLAEDLPAAITLQARLRRTRDDLAPLLEKPTSVRLVKGAFPLGPEHDYQGSAEISRNFLSLAGMMLSPAARRAGFYPSFPRSAHTTTCSPGRSSSSPERTAGSRTSTRSSSSTVSAHRGNASFGTTA